jgi:hypothetical protein
MFHDSKNLSYFSRAIIAVCQSGDVVLEQHKRSVTKAITYRLIGAFSNIKNKERTEFSNDVPFMTMRE